MADPILSLRQVNKSFGPVHVLKNVDFDAHAGKVTALVGDNGAGKSTLIKCIAGIYTPETGEFIFEGNPVTISNPRRVGLGLTNLKSLSWSGLNNLIGISAGAAGLDTPSSIVVGGGTSQLTTLTNLKTAIGNSDSSVSYVLDENGILFEYRGLGWLAVETDVRATHFTGN